MAIDRIGSSSINLPPNWLSQVTSRGGNIGNSREIRKVLGEPLPQIVDPSVLAAHIAKFFRKNGLLERLRKKLSLISRKKGGKIFAAKNTIACVDEDDNLYVGVEFLEQYGDDEEVVAGILAHEWGHMMSDLPKGVDWSHLTWDELYEMRRTEEADADGFAGRALFLMNYSYENVVKFFKKLKASQKKKTHSHKYHNTATRCAIFEESWKAEKRAMEVAKRLFFSEGKTDGPKIGKVIGEG
ncbi:MAG: hypothetical protein ABIE74_03995 [Pseudomonadota bacterium]